MTTVVEYDVISDKKELVDNTIKLDISDSQITAKENAVDIYTCNSKI